MLRASPRAQQEGIRHMIMLIADGTQTSFYGGDREAVHAAQVIKTTGTTIVSVGFDRANKPTLDAIATEPASENSFYSSDVDGVKAYLSDMCTIIFSPRVPPMPAAPPLPHVPTGLPERPPIDRCSNVCLFSNDGTCDDGGSGSEFSVCAFDTDRDDCGGCRIYYPPSPPTSPPFSPSPERPPPPPPASPLPLAPSPNLPPPSSPRCAIPLDLVLVLDSSGSMWPFQTELKALAKDILGQFDLRPGAVQI
eukprot:3198195-Prymnesium_polylepis.1